MKTIENIDQYFDSQLNYINKKLHSFLPNIEDVPQQLNKAIHYVCMSGGKRIRPQLVYAIGHPLAAEPNDLDRIACSIEMIHVYSLTHDDLPAMDNDELRRGQPTCHVAFDEATAILVGDALQSLAFGILAENYYTSLPPLRRLEIINTLAQSCGTYGMAGGQALDLAATGEQIKEKEIEKIHRAKTGKLIEATIQMSVLASPLKNDEIKIKLYEFSKCIGLAFQIQDDIIDVESSTEQLGKKQGADNHNQKATYVSVLGIEKAKQKRDELFKNSINLIENTSIDFSILKRLAEIIVQRDF